jgi:hypothetical protein
VSFVLGTPVKFNDPSGHWVETAWDVANIVWDAYEVQKDPSAWNIGALMVDVVAAVLPFVPAGAGLIVRAGKTTKAGIDIASHADDIIDAAKGIDKIEDAVEAAGQLHHMFSTKIMKGLQEHKVLKNLFKRDDFLVQSVDKASHNGYQEWHRVYDDKVVDWLNTNIDATPQQFLKYLQELYEEADMEHSFPDAWKLLQMAIEEIE